MTIIRPMQPADKEAVLAMMEVFYTSPAVFTNGSATIYSNDFEACVSDNPYLEGYMFEENGQIQGYAMTAKSFSTEFGRPKVGRPFAFSAPLTNGPPASAGSGAR